MLSALLRNGIQVLASETDRNQGAFGCPSCGTRVALRKGKLKIAHFAHLPPVTCRFGKPESELHRRCKLEIYQTLSNRREVTHLALERPLGEVRPDVSAVIRGAKVAIEVQVSVLDLETVIRRCGEYAKRGIALIWITPWTNRLRLPRYSPSARETWLHSAYFGSVFYWRSGLSLIPYRFDPCVISVPKMEWRDKKGQRVGAGGYDRKSRRYRTPVPGPELNLVDDFAAVDRLPWAEGGFDVPAMKLWTRRRGKREEEFPQRR